MPRQKLGWTPLKYTRQKMWRKFIPAINCFFGLLKTLTTSNTPASEIFFYGTESNSHSMLGGVTLHAKRPPALTRRRETFYEMDPSSASEVLVSANGMLIG